MKNQNFKIPQESTKNLVLIKEIRLHDAEMKVKSLEKDNCRLKEHEEFYINKAREWKNRALKYERSLQEHGIPVPSRGAKPAEAENKENSRAEAKVGSFSRH